MEKAGLALSYLNYKISTLASKAIKQPQRLKHNVTRRLCKNRPNMFSDSLLYDHQPKKFRIARALVVDIAHRTIIEDVTQTLVRFWANNKFDSLKIEDIKPLMKGDCQFYEDQEIVLEVEYVFYDVHYVILYKFDVDIEYPPYKRKNDERLKAYRCVGVDIEEAKLVRSQLRSRPQSMETSNFNFNFEKIHTINDDTESLDVTDTIALLLGPGDLLYKDTKYEIDKETMCKWLLTKTVAEFKALEILWTNGDIETLAFVEINL